MTAAGERADLFIRGEAGKVLTALVEELDIPRSQAEGEAGNQASACEGGLP